MPEKMTNSENKKSKGFRMPGAFTILFILTIFSVLATWWIPAGSYSKLQFDTASSKLVVTDPNGKTVHVPATQTQLDKMNV
ncbi:hypothetical protein LZU60_05790, partial [Streptococcus agalactiae]|nr:hypothetical protein [Streptococcus agalactiae]MCK6331204.1 hypothetical protein [Streptococcus agalactiae]